jgi:hypothetical protein
MIENMIRGTGEWKKLDESEEWSAFEGADEKSMQRICRNVNQAIGRDANLLYGSRRLNPKFQVAADESSETMIELQKVRRDLKRLKDVIDLISEGGEVEIEVKAETAEMELKLDLESLQFHLKRSDNYFNTPAIKSKRIRDIQNVSIAINNDNIFLISYRLLNE